MPAKTLDEMKSPTKKLLAFFQRSRDGWKAKYMALKKRSAVLANQVYAVEKSREEWRKRAKAAERQVAELLKDQKKAMALSNRHPN